MGNHNYKLLMVYERFFDTAKLLSWTAVDSVLLAINAFVLIIIDICGHENNIYIALLLHCTNKRLLCTYFYDSNSQHWPLTYMTSTLIVSSIVALIVRKLEHILFKSKEMCGIFIKKLFFLAWRPDDWIMLMNQAIMNASHNFYGFNSCNF